MTRLLRNLSGKEIIRALEKLGFVQVRQKGSHVTMRKYLPEGDIGCVVPMHKEVTIGTIQGVLKQAKITVEEFSKNL